MADQEKSLECLSKLKLQELDEEWVKSLWNCDFTEFDELDVGVQDELQANIYHIETLRQLQSVLDDWISQKENQDGDGLWTVLVENQISQKHLIALFAYLIDIAQKKSSDSTQKQAGMLSSSSYLKLLAVPGSMAFKVFNPVLFEKVVDMLKMWTSVGTSKRKKNVSPAVSQKSKKNKGNRTSHHDPTIDINQDFDASDEEDEAEELAPREILIFRKLLLSLLKDLVFLLETTPLRQSEASLYHTVQTLARLTREDTELFDGVFEMNCPSGRLPLPGLAYKGLVSLCKPLHGHIALLFTATCKYLLPNLLMLQGENKVTAQNIPKHAQVAREHATNFICYMLDHCEDRLLNSVCTLLQHMCTKVPDKSEYRAKVSQAIVTILGKLPSKSYSKMVEWLYRLSKHHQMSNRAFVMEIVTLLLAIPEKEVEEGTPERIAAFVKHNSLMNLLLERCSDVSPTVRSRAITAFSQCLMSNDAQIRCTLRDMVTPWGAVRPAHAPHLIPTPDMENRLQAVTQNSSLEQTVNRTEQNNQNPPVDAETPVNGAPPPNDTRTPFQGVPLTPYNPNLPDSDGVMSMLRRRARDEKVNVRKAALQALENVIRFEAPDYRRQNLDMLVERCRDPALSARKQAMQSLTDLLLNMPKEIPLQQAWLEGVIPLVIDRETTLQEKCLEVIEEIIIHNIVPFNKSTSQSHRLTWDILTIIEKNENVEFRRYLHKACIYWSRLGKIKHTVISALETHIDTNNNQAAWMLFAEIAPAAPKLGHSFIVQYWDKQDNAWDETNYTTLQRVLTVMTYAAKTIQPENRTSLIESMKTRLMRFDSAPELIAITIKALSKLSDAQAMDTGKNKNIERDAWCISLLEACDRYLSHVILNEEGDIEEEKIVCHLFTLGEIVQLCPGKVPKRIFLLVQSLIAAPCITTMPPSQTLVASQGDQKNSRDPLIQDNKNQSDSLSSSHASTPDSEASCSQNQRPSSQTSQNSDSAQTQLTQATQVLTHFRGSKMSNRIRAFAFIALGKLCLQNSDLAKKCVAALARELETSNDSTIRNNVVIILCDLCVRYTTTADRYVSNIAACLKDTSPLVRKQTLTLITRLLQEDFMKWKGVLFFRFITTLLDDQKDIAEFAEFCLIHMLFKRHPNMFFHHFMECIFHFNAYEGYGAYNKFTQSEREKTMFRLQGKKYFKQRQHLYMFMLENMTDEHRFQMTAKICQEILGGFADGIIPLNDHSTAILQDSLAILSSKEIKLSSLHTRGSEDVAGDEQEMAAVVIATAKKTIITQVVKKNVIENVVPIVISLKHMLEKHRSPLLRDLMGYLRELMKDYKTEVKDILVADKQLASEIEYDLKRFEEQGQIEQNAAPSVQNTPNVRPAPDANKQAPEPVASTDNPTLVRSPNVSASGTTDTPHSQPPRESSDTQTDNRFRSPAPVKATNSRNTPQGAVAGLNSAKKLLEKAQQLHKSLSESPSKTKQCRHSGITKIVPEICAEDTNENDTPGVRFSVDGSRTNTPRKNTDKTKRAISTPTGALHNITFHMDQNITMIPPSPIPTSMPIRVFPDDDSGPATTPSKRTGRPGEVMQDAIFMFSPEKPLPKPRVWNVQFPASGVATSKTESSKENYEDVLSKLSHTSKSNKTATQKTATRRSDRRSKNK